MNPSITSQSVAEPMTDAQLAELQKRIEEDDANPDDVTTDEATKPLIVVPK